MNSTYNALTLYLGWLFWAIIEALWHWPIPDFSQPPHFLSQPSFCRKETTFHWGQLAQERQKKKKKSKGFGSVTRAIVRPAEWKGLILKMFLTMSQPIPNGVKQEKHSLRESRSVMNSQGTLTSLTLPSVSHSFWGTSWAPEGRCCLCITHPLSSRGWHEICKVTPRHSKSQWTKS